MQNVNGRKTLGVASGGNGDGVAVSGGLAGSSFAVCPREPGAGGYFSTPEWIAVYPEVLKEYYRSFGRVGDCVCRGVCSVGDADRDAGVSRSFSDGVVIGDIQRSSGRSACAGADEQCTLDGEECVGLVGEPKQRVSGEQLALRGCAGGPLVGSLRGKNFLRNQANRLKKREVALARKAEYLQLVEKKSVTPPVRCQRTEQEQELHELRVKRQIFQEKRKLEKLNSPAQIIEDAMRQVAFAERCAKMANDSKVAAWAADLSSASAESLARSAGTFVESVPSGVKSVAGDRSVSRVGSRGSGFGSGSASGKGVCKVVREKVVHAPEHVTGLYELDVISGHSLDGNSVEYTRETAAQWLKRYVSCTLVFRAGISPQELAGKSKVSLMEARKYLRLKAEFDL